MKDAWEERLVNLTDIGLYRTLYSKLRQFYRPQKQKNGNEKQKNGNRRLGNGRKTGH